MGNSLGVVLYQDVNYKGQSTYLGVGTHVGGSSYVYDTKGAKGLAPSSKNVFKSNDVSSLSIANGYGIILKAADGSTLQFVNNQPMSGDNHTTQVPLKIPNLGKYGFNDKAVEVTIFKSTGGFRINDQGQFVEPFNYDFAGCQNKIIYVILAIFTALLIWLAVKIYWKPKSLTDYVMVNDVTGRW